MLRKALSLLVKKERQKERDEKRVAQQGQSERDALKACICDCSIRFTI
jgi:hypothetical protein